MQFYFKVVIKMFIECILLSPLKLNHILNRLLMLQTYVRVYHVQNLFHFLKCFNNGAKQNTLTSVHCCCSCSCTCRSEHFTLTETAFTIKKELVRNQGITLNVERTVLLVTFAYKYE